MDDNFNPDESALTREETIAIIPAHRLRVLNPRSRGALFFSQLVENIATVGLKRPITVAVGGTDEEGEWYEILCGQGRFEALKALGDNQIPCAIVEAKRVDRFLITLTENLARRKHTTEELLNGLQVLKNRGYTTEEIAKKTNLDPAYINGILHLLDSGEARLLRAVEKKTVPMWIALDIARSPTADVQTALMAAYEDGTLKGDQLMKVRKLISKRDAAGKQFFKSGTAAKEQEKATPQKLFRTYQTEVRRQKLIIQKADIQERRMLLITSTFKKLLGDELFRTLLRAEGIRDIPQPIADRLPQELLP